MLDLGHANYPFYNPLKKEVLAKIRIKFEKLKCEV